MDRFIPREKLGKKARKALDSRRRAAWSFSPTTRKVESKKRYNRKKHDRLEYGIVHFDFTGALGFAETRRQSLHSFVTYDILSNSVIFR